MARGMEEDLGSSRLRESAVVGDRDGHCPHLSDRAFHCVHLRIEGQLVNSGFASTTSSSGSHAFTEPHEPHSTRSGAPRTSSRSQSMTQMGHRTKCEF